MITFDEWGVSGHPNHISVYYGVQRALCVLPAHQRVLGLKLKSRPIVRKFLGLLDIPLSMLFAEQFVFKISPLLTIWGMMAHASQNVWYRKLFVLFSSFTFVNSFEKLQ